jgi:tyrosinase
MEGWNSPTGDPTMHNQVHDWVGGSMLTMFSPNDPVFWLVHANLDRLWAEWEDEHGYDYPVSGAPPGQNLYDLMDPFGVTPASVLDHHQLGYYYDTEKSAAVPEPASFMLLLLGSIATVVLEFRGRKSGVRGESQLPKTVR